MPRNYINQLITGSHGIKFNKKNFSKFSYFRSIKCCWIYHLPSWRHLVPGITELMSSYTDGWWNKQQKTSRISYWCKSNQPTSNPQVLETIVSYPRANTAWINGIQCHWWRLQDSNSMRAWWIRDIILTNLNFIEIIWADYSNLISFDLNSSITAQKKYWGFCMHLGFVQ